MKALRPIFNGVVMARSKNAVRRGTKPKILLENTKCLLIIIICIRFHKLQLRSKVLSYSRFEPF